jgi:SAM-dependent methyltransferase
MGSAAAAAAWDAEYASGSYQGAPPVPFTRDIVAAAAGRGLTRGLYIGCGNGRNLLPMLAAGLDLTGLDISAQAIGQLRLRRPDLAGRLITGDLAALPPDVRYELVIGIQVFQHGTRAQAHRHLAGAAARVAPGGLLCVRVNACGTDIGHEHERFEEQPDGSYTVRYLAGPKAGLAIHFFTAAELAGLAGDGFAQVLPFRLDSTPRTPPSAGQWSQWEVIWQRQAGRAPTSMP